MSGATPPLVCNAPTDPATVVTIRGENLAPLPEDTLTDQSKLELPEISLTRKQDVTGGAVTGTPVQVTEGVAWKSSSEMSFEVPTGAALEAGIYDITVTNPDDKTATLTRALAVVDAPTITSLEPEEICTEKQDTVVVVNGTSFVFGEGTTPVVTVNGMTYTAANPMGCTALPSPAQATQLCTSFEIVIPQSALDVGEYTVTVTNPAPAGCSSDGTAVLKVFAPPRVDSVAPSPICSTEDETIVVSGEGFREGAVVIFDGDAALTFPATVSPDGMSLTVTLPMGTLEAGEHTVTVDNGDGCPADSPQKLKVNNPPFVFFVDPPAVWNGISTRVTIYLTYDDASLPGTDDPPPQVSIRLHGTTGDKTPLTEVAPVGTAFNQVQATVPAGLPAGKYDVFYQDETCEAVLENGLQIVADSTPLAGISPRFGFYETETAVTITKAADTPTAFTAGSRVYISKRVDADAGEAPVATALKGVTLKDANTITAIVPTLPVEAAGQYDVIVVSTTIDAEGNAMTTVFVLNAPDLIYHVTAVAPPVIESLNPGAVETPGTPNFTIEGSGFVIDAADTTKTQVTLECRTPDGTSAPVGATVVVDAESSATALRVDPPDLVADTVCLVRVWNGTPNGTTTPTDVFSALAVTNSSGNLAPFTNSNEDATLVPLSTARMDLGSTALRATKAERHLYAIGGSGEGGVLLDTVESIPVSLFGALQGTTWRTQPNKLTTAKARFGTARIGRFVYAIGGTGDPDADGTSQALATIERARILDPLDIPDATISELTPVDTGGLGAGTYVYQVAGLRAADYPSDPDGETLPSEPIVVILPALEGKQLDVTISWTLKDTYAGYKIYRTPVGGNITEIREIATVAGDASSYTDTGVEFATDAGVPHQIGDLGRWHAPKVGDVATNEPATLVTARQAPGVAATKVREDDTTETWFLYVGGGAGDGLDTVYDSIEYTVITVTKATGAQAVAAMTEDDTLTIGTARSFVATWLVDQNVKNHTALETNHFVYFGSGANNGVDVAETVVGTIDRASTTGQLTAVQTLQPEVGTWGGGAIAANEQLFFMNGDSTLGGAGATVAASICPVTGCASPPPAIQNFNAGGGGVPDVGSARFGTAFESAFIFLLGGTTDGTAPSALVQATIL